MPSKRVPVAGFFWRSGIAADRGPDSAARLYTSRVPTTPRRTPLPRCAQSTRLPEACASFHKRDADRLLPVQSRSMSDLLRDPELDQLIGELNRGGQGTAGGEPPVEHLPADDLLLTPPPAAAPERRLVEVDPGEPFARLLSEVTRRGASDLLLLTGLSPVLRLDGRLVATDLEPLEEEDLRQMLAPYQGARARKQLDEEGSADFSLRLGASSDSGGWRFRVNLHRQRGRLAAAVRALPREIPTLQKLNLPKSFSRLVQQAHGLVLICGPTGSGKSSTLAAAETGHLILSTLHTSDVVQAVHRIVDVFPTGRQSQIRQQLALSLHAIVFQQLLPRTDVPGRIPAVELLLATYPVRHHIRSQHLQKLYNEVTLGKNQGMLSFEESLATLVKEGKVDPEEARMRSARPEELESLLRK